YVVSNDYLVERNRVAGSMENGLLTPLRQAWPDQRAQRHGYTLSWLGMTNRYFALAMYPPPPAEGAEAATSQSLALPEAQLVQRVTLNRASKEAHIALLTTSEPVQAPAGG